MTQTTSEIVARARARLAEIQAEHKAKIAAQDSALRAKLAESSILSVSPHKVGWQIDSSQNWNEQQLSAINAGIAGKSFCLMGAAGTGKTTTLKGLVNSLISNAIVPALETNTKHLKLGQPGIVLCSFTNMAVRQIAKHFPKNIHCVTIHKLLEFAPVKYEITKEDGTTGYTMRFEPSRHRGNPLPATLKTIVVDESSMVDTDLINLLIDALPNPAAVQWIFVGDLNQLPPVYGHAILGRKLLELPVIELTQVYRQALLSPIISLATDIKVGKAIAFTDKLVMDNGEHGKVTIHPWSKALQWEDALNKAANFCKAAIKEELLDVYKDIILCPYNVNFGVIELNSRIADWLGRERKAKVVEVIAGFNSHYYALGDKVLVRKREAIITGINKNLRYAGKQPTNPDIYELDRWGGAKKRATAAALSASQLYQATHGSMDVDAILESLSATHSEVEDRKHACSHQLKVRFINGTDPRTWTDFDSAETDELFETATLDTAADVNEMLFAYAITVHKSQGSEWRKVFLITHQSHAKMQSRELIYTAITRAAKELYIICEPDRGMKAGTLTRAAKNPRLKGDTLAEKLASLKEKFDQEAREQQKAGKLVEDEE
jgi:ATP-dependent exoDNAse (exonuclease V) alpha subunit